MARFLEKNTIVNAPFGGLLWTESLLMLAFSRLLLGNLKKSFENYSKPLQPHPKTYLEGIYPQLRGAPIAWQDASWVTKPWVIEQHQPAKHGKVNILNIKSNAERQIVPSTIKWLRFFLHSWHIGHFTLICRSETRLDSKKNADKQKTCCS